MVGARGVSLVQPWGPIKVKAHDEGGDPEGSAAVALRVPLSTKHTLTELPVLETFPACKADSGALTTRRATRNAFSWLSIS